MQSGALTEAELTVATTRLWTGAISLGLIDDPAASPFASLGARAVDTPATRKLNVEAAEQAMVLMKNERGMLPIKPGATVALLGPHFNSTQDLLSDYCPGQWPGVRSALMGAQEALGERLVGFAQGCGLEGNDTSGFATAVALAKKADVAVVLVGLTASSDPANSGTPPVVAHGDAYEDEGHDRTEITLQGEQEALIKAVVMANPNTVVVLIHGGSLAIEWTRDNVPAILDAHYPGQQGGDALWNVLLGTNGAGPAGRLTQTVYRTDFVDHKNMSDMSLANITWVVHLTRMDRTLRHTHARLRGTSFLQAFTDVH